MTGRASLERDGDVAVLTLTRTDAHNAIDAAMVDALGAAVAAVPADARALLIRADGAAFTVGGDLAYFADQARAGRLAEALEPMVRPYHDTLAAIEELPIPVICGVHGPAAGGGLGLLWVSDVVIAADDLRLATGFAAIALSGDGASSWHLPRLIGRRRAQELLLENRVLGADEAREWGLVTRVVPRADLDDAARQTAARLAAGPTGALGELKALLRDSGARTLREHHAAELAAIVRTGGQPDAAEGVTAFAERRRPSFAGTRAPAPDIEALVRRAYAALAAGDAEALRGCLADDFTGELAAGMPVGAGRHGGADAMIEDGWWAIGRAYAVRAEPEEYVACADGRLLVTGTYRGTRRADGAPVEAAFTHVWRATGGRLTAVAQVTDTARWAGGA